MSKQEIGRATYHHQPLEEILMQMQDYGDPSISLHDRGWHCSVRMNINAAGTEFRVRSDFDHPTPTAAAIQCQDRIREAVTNKNQSR